MRFLLFSAIWILAMSGMIYILYRIIRNGLAAAEANARAEAHRQRLDPATYVPRRTASFQDHAQVHHTTEVIVNGRRVEDPLEAAREAQRVGRALGVSMGNMSAAMQSLGPSLRSFDHAGGVTPPTTTRRGKAASEKEKTDPPSLWDHLMEDD